MAEVVTFLEALRRGRSRGAGRRARRRRARPRRLLLVPLGGVTLLGSRRRPGLGGVLPALDGLVAATALLLLLRDGRRRRIHGQSCCSTWRS
jgi:hypothetical protein